MGAEELSLKTCWLHTCEAKWLTTPVHLWRVAGAPPTHRLCSVACHNASCDALSVLQ
jgi:hypothetical protein